MERIETLKPSRNGLNVNRALQQAFAQACRAKGKKIQDAADAMLAWWLSLDWAERVRIHDAGLAQLERMGLIEPEVPLDLASSRPASLPAEKASLTKIRGGKVSTNRKTRSS
jgi:hypothetical protein